MLCLSRNQLIADLAYSDVSGRASPISSVPWVGGEAINEVVDYLLVS